MGAFKDYVYGLNEAVDLGKLDDAYTSPIAGEADLNLLETDVFPEFDELDGMEFDCKGNKISVVFKGKRKDLPKDIVDDFKANRGRVIDVLKFISNNFVKLKF